MPDLNHSVASCWMLLEAPAFSFKAVMNSASVGTSTTFVLSASSGRRMACGVSPGDTRSAFRARNFQCRPLGGARGLPRYFASVTPDFFKRSQ